MGIIVEGADGSGKTSLVRHLLEVYPQLELQPRVVSKDTESMVDLEKWVEADNKLPRDPKRLYDRHRMVSHPIYNGILGRDMTGSWQDFEWLEAQWVEFKNQGHLMLYCLPPRALVVHNCEVSIDNATIAPVAGRVWDAYSAHVAMIQRYHSRTMLYDYTGSTESGATLEFVVRRTGAYLRNYNG